jgi:hypothetical protein
MIVANSAVALLYLLASAAMAARLPSAPGWAFPVLGLIGIANVVCAVAIFLWKKWGFWGSIVTSIVTFAINLNIGLNVVQAVLGLLGVVILYLVLQIGGENKGWTQLE